MTICLVKSIKILCQWLKFLSVPVLILYLFKNKIIFHFEKFVATKKVKRPPPPVLLLLDPASKIRDPGMDKIKIWDKHP
jgi:hypothetical protein